MAAPGTEDKISFTFTWELRDFTKLSHKTTTSNFEAGFYTWSLLCFPKQNASPGTHVSLFLRCMDSQHIPNGKGPNVEGVLTVQNHLTADKSIRKAFEHTFTADMDDWGFSQMLPLVDATEEGGFLREGGTMVISVEMSVSCKRRKTARSVGSDLLTLLDGPGRSLADITLIAGGRSFPAHRAILAARCPYFATMFASGFEDSGAREVALQEADPDALELLLRVMYGGNLVNCPRRVLRPAVELADLLQLTDACKMLTEHLEATCTRKSVVEDLLWAAARDESELQSRLEAFYLENVGELQEEAQLVLAQNNPQLMVRLHRALAINAVARK